jgi:hypothetical protein
MLRPGDTTMTNLAISTDLILGNESRNKVWYDLKATFSSRQFATKIVKDTIYRRDSIVYKDSIIYKDTILYANKMKDIEDTVYIYKGDTIKAIWVEPFVEKPADEEHSFFNLNSWEMLYNVNGWNRLLFTIREADIN